ncbi:MAG TPA: FtsX-like permease family protein [Actinomycetes bacterium]|nr:FtsX-like permease family protein [Actinomycetes bacterium]
MLFTTIKNLIAHKFRLFATALAVTLGVAFMAGTLVLTDTVTKTFDDLFGDVYRQTDAVVRGEKVFDGGPNVGAQRGRLDESLLETVRQVPGVDEAQGGVFGYARLIGSDGEALGNPATGAPAIGLNWSDSKRLNPFQIVEGGPPAADDEVVIDARSAEIGRLAVGDTTTVLVQGPPLQVTISGVARFGTVKTPGGSTVVMFRDTVAQELVAEPGKFDDISVVASPGVSQRELVADIRRVLPAGAEAVTGTKITAETQDEVRRGLAFFRTFMLVFAVVALLVGAFMIFNTFSITVAQRTRENGLLRALGAGRRQIMASVVIEAFVVGLLASVLGVVAGLGVAYALQQLLKALGMIDTLGGVVFAPRTVLISMVAGIGVTVLAALSPARKAAKVPPIAAMQEGLAGSTGYGSRQRVYVGAGVLLVGLATLLTGLFGSVDNAVMVVGAGVLLVFFGVSVLGRTVSLPLSRLIGWPLPRLRGITGEIARDNAMRNPKRTAASASALMIGVGLVGFITIFVSSAKASQDAAIDQAFTGDIVISSGAGLVGGVDPGLARDVNALPEVSYATGVRQGFASVEGDVTFVTGVNTATAFDVIDIQPIDGTPADLSRFAIAVSKDVASDKKLAVGDTLDVAFKDTGAQTLRVSMIYARDEVVGSYLLGMPAYEGNFATSYDAQVAVKKAPEVSEEAALAAVERASEAYAGVSVLDRDGFKEEQSAWLDGMLGLVYALLALAIIIALLGIANTLALSIFERTREIGLLRAVGMTRSQLRSAIRWESVIIALQGTLLGLVIGLFFGWALIRALEDEGLTVFRVPYGSLAVIVVLAALAGMVAAIGPGRRAAKLNVLRAVVSE